MTETISIKQIYNELRKIEREMVTKKEINTLIDTIEIINNPETLKQIAGSIEDIKCGRVREVSSAKDLMSEM